VTKIALLVGGPCDGEQVEVRGDLPVLVRRNLEMYVRKAAVGEGSKPFAKGYYVWQGVPSAQQAELLVTALGVNANTKA
jgi:hypothetical protein